MKSRRVLVAAPLLIAALALSACGTGAPGKNSAGQLTVVASFYPLQFATEQIGGDHVAVTSLTRPGAEPHDIELTTHDVATVSMAGLVIYEKGLQGAVDKAAESQAGDRSLNVAPAANLNLRLASGTTDPHFWLDPQRYSDVANVIAARLSSADPANKADYEKNAKVFEDKLAVISEEFTRGLANCQRRDIVTSHAAFGYLAQRFGMRQIAINGISPDQEPNATELAAVSNYARAHGVTTVYAETLASPAIAATVARESGARVATLDPIEGLTKQSAGKDYFEVMRSNLTALRAGQGCS
jgi:ABC-type metal ion transport system, periplasmic component/surface adhesin